MIFALYAQVFGFDFLNFDDPVYITKNPYVLGGLNWNNIKWAFSTAHGGHYHPLTWIFHQLDVSLFGLNAGSHHGINLLIHTLNLGLFFIWLKQLQFKSWGILAAVLIFAIHPYRIESVAWVTEKKDVLSSFFGITTLILYTHFTQTQKSSYKNLALISFTLGLLCKPSLVIIPVLLMLIEFWPLKIQRSFKGHFQTKGLFFLLSLLISAIVLYTQNIEGALKPTTHTPLAVRFVTGFYGYWVYLYKSFWPGPFSIFHPYKIYPFYYGAVSCVALLIVSALAWIKKNQYPTLFATWFWFLVSLLPVVGFIKVGGQFMAERWTYWPHIGFSLLIASAISQPGFKRYTVSLIGTVAFCLFLSQTLAYLPQYKNSQLLFTNAIQTNSQNYLAHTNLGLTYLKSNPQKAKSHFEKAIRIHPGYSVALNNLGLIEAKQNNIQKAYKYFVKALEINPKSINFQYNTALAEHGLKKTVSSLKRLVSIYNSQPKYHQAHQTLQHILAFHKNEICAAKLSLIQKNTINHFIELKNLQKLNCVSDSIQ